MLRDIYNYRELSPTLACSGQPDEAELASIAAAGYATVINLGLHDDPRYALADEAGTVRALGMRYVHIPVPFDAPDEPQLDDFFAAMRQHLGTGVWVHCAAGKRASVFLGLYAHLCEGQALAAAFALQRELWEPDAIWAQFIQQVLARRGPASSPQALARAETR